MNMLSAKEVRELQKEVINIHSDLNIIFEFIRVSVFNNPNETKILHVLGDEVTYKGLPEPRISEKMLIDALERLGYRVEYRWEGDPWLDNRHCMHDDDAADEYDNRVLEISWKG